MKMIRSVVVFALMSLSAHANQHKPYGKHRDSYGYGSSSGDSSYASLSSYKDAPYEAEYSTKDTSYGHAGRSKYGDDYDSGRSYVEKPTYNSYGDGDYGYGQGSCLEPKEFTVKGGFFKRNLKDRDEPTTTTEEEEVETVEATPASGLLLSIPDGKTCRASFKFYDASYTCCPDTKQVNVHVYFKPFKLKKKIKGCVAKIGSGNRELPLPLPKNAYGGITGFWTDGTTESVTSGDKPVPAGTIVSTTAYNELAFTSFLVEDSSNAIEHDWGLVADFRYIAKDCRTPVDKYVPYDSHYDH